MTVKAADFDHIVQKLGLRTQKGGDRLAWLEHEGRIILRTKRSEKRGDLPFQHSIGQQLKLNEDQLRRAASCSFDRDEYLTVLRQRGYL